MSSLDVRAAAEYLGVSESYVRKLVLERRVAYFKVGRLVRFETADLDAFKAAGRVEAQPVPSLPRGTNMVYGELKVRPRRRREAPATP